MTTRTDTKPAVVVGYGGDERSRDALALGAFLADTIGGRLVVAQVYEQPHHPSAGAMELATTAREGAIASLDGVDGGKLGVPVERRALAASSTPRGLHELAEEVGAVVVVVGSTHRGAIGRVLPGSTGERLLQESPCAVVIAPLGFADRLDSPVALVAAGYERTDESEAAVRLAARMAADAGASLRVVTVVDPRPDLYAAPMAASAYLHTLAEERERARAALAELRESLPADLPVELELRDGTAAGELVRAAAGVDLMVLGSRAYGPLGRALIGSVSGTVARRANCPVMIVPRAAVRGSHASGREALTEAAR